MRGPVHHHVCQNAHSSAARAQISDDFQAIAPIAIIASARKTIKCCIVESALSPKTSRMYHARMAAVDRDSCRPQCSVISDGAKPIDGRAGAGTQARRYI